MAEKRLQAEQERLKVGLSTTRFVLDFQRDLATAQGNELRATVDYNKSLSNLARNKATTLERYNLRVEYQQADDRVWGCVREPYHTDRGTGAALALLPLTATFLYYASPLELRQLPSISSFLSFCAYAALLTWSRINHSSARRLGLTGSLVPQGLRWGIPTGLVLGTLNLLVILYLVPLLGGDYRFLAHTPHAQIPLFVVMVPWFILFIATFVELNFRGFFLGGCWPWGFLPPSLCR